MMDPNANPKDCCPTLCANHTHLHKHANLHEYIHALEPHAFAVRGKLTLLQECNRKNKKISVVVELKKKQRSFHKKTKITYAQTTVGILPPCSTNTHTHTVLLLSTTIILLLVTSLTRNPTVLSVLCPTQNCIKVEKYSSSLEPHVKIHQMPSRAIPTKRKRSM